MTALPIALLGLGSGVGLVITARGLRPRPAPLRGDGRSRAAIAALRAVEGLGVDPARWHRDLEVLERTSMRHASEKLLGAGAGALVPLVATLGFAQVGRGLALPLVGLLSTG